MQQFNKTSPSRTEKRTIQQIDRYLDKVKDPEQLEQLKMALEGSDQKLAAFLLVLPNNHADIIEKLSLFQDAYMGSGKDEEATLDLLLFASPWQRQIEKLKTATGEPVMNFIRWDSDALWRHYEELYEFAALGDGSIHVYDKRVINEYFNEE